jgi:iron complex outermembrane receptor protein
MNNPFETFGMSAHRRLLIGAAASALMCASPAFAQVAEVEETEDEVITTGIRQSIEDALDLKRNAGGIVEAITAEDIGKLPDISIADSLARLPGLTAQRVRGRAQQISIRGLGPDFSLSLLNGREVVSASSQRGIEFDQFPSELIGSAVVYKTPVSDLAAIGVAGAVDLRTIRPLDFNDDQLSLSAKYVVNDNGQLNPDFSDDGYRLFGSWITQNDAKTFGLSLGVTTQSNPTQYFARELKTGPGQFSTLPDGTRYASDNPRTGVVSRNFERTSVAGTLQFEPTDQASFVVDAFWSDFDDTGIFRGVETPLASWAGVNLDSSSGSGTFVDSATYSPVGAILRTDTEGAEAELFAIGANFALEFDSGWDLELDASFSELDRTDIDYESYAGTAFQALFGPRNNEPGVRGSITYRTPANGAYSIDSEIDYANPGNVVLTDPGGWGQVGFINSPNIDDELTQLRGSLGKDIDVVPLLSRIEVGAIHTSREKNFRNDRTFLRAGTAFVNGEATIPAGAVLGTTDSGSIGLDIVAYDPADLLSVYSLDPVAAINAPFYGINESINILYARADFAAMDERLTGNIGVQFHDVEQSSVGRLESASIAPRLQEVGTSYDHVLPSLNLAYNITDDVVLRGSVGKSVTRPRLDDLAANQSFSTNPLVCPDIDGDLVPDQFLDAAFNPPSAVCVSTSGGNPFLQPYESTNFDLSTEWYFSPAGALSVAVFHKDLNEYVQGSSAILTDADFVSTLIPSSFIGANPNAATFSIGGPQNVGEGSITGVELALRLPFEDVFDAPFLEGFGFNGSYTYVDAEVEFSDIVIPIPGYSQDVASGEVYYEKNGFRARVNTSYRSEYLAGLIDFAANPIFLNTDSRTTVDAQIGYEFQDGPLEGTSFLIEAYNLNDEPFRTFTEYGDGEAFPSIREDYGTTYNFTVAKKF